MVALEGVLVGAAPGVVNAHRVVGGDGAVEKRPTRAAAILGLQRLESADLVPERENRALLGREIDLRIHFLKRHDDPF